MRCYNIKSHSLGIGESQSLERLLCCEKLLPCSLHPILAFTAVHKHSWAQAHTLSKKEKKYSPHSHYIKSLNYGLPISSQCTVCLFSAKLDVLSRTCFHVQTTPRDAPNPAGRSEKINTAIITEERDMGHVWHDKPQMDISGRSCLCVCVCMCGGHVCVYICTPFCVSGVCAIE